jgi:hypothetical protein
MINSTVSSESAPRSFVKDAACVTSLSSTPSLSTMIDITFDLMSDISSLFKVLKVQRKKHCAKKPNKSA